MYSQTSEPSFGRLSGEDRAGAYTVERCDSSLTSGYNWRWDCFQGVHDTLLAPWESWQVPRDVRALPLLGSQLDCPCQLVLQVVRKLSVSLQMFATMMSVVTRIRPSSSWCTCGKMHAVAHVVERRNIHYVYMCTKNHMRIYIYICKCIYTYAYTHIPYICVYV